MTFRLLFRCGTEGRVKDGQEPVCPSHGQPCGVARVLDTHALIPRIVGTATGPHVTTQTLDPATPTIGEARLSLKVETTHAE